MPRLFMSPMSEAGSSTGRGEGISFGVEDHREPAVTEPPSSSSVRLSCSSPDGKAVHSFVYRNDSSYIETHTLPLIGTVEMAENTKSTFYEDKASIIRTKLPQKISSAVLLNPAIELLCVDVDSSPVSFLETSRNNRKRKPMPSLCLYTKKDVFLLQFSYEPTGAAEVEGILESVKEPYEDFFLGCTSYNILRIQQAPQKIKGYATMCPSTAMAMLTYDTTMNEYCLCLYHGGTRGNSETTPHNFRLEYTAEPTEQILDFSFCQSTGLPLLSSLTVAFLKGSGVVLFATPILFQGTVVPKNMVSRTLEYLDASIQEASPMTAHWRQFKIARQFLADAFPDSGPSNFISTAIGIASHNSRSAAFDWPVQMQGPLVIPTPFDDGDYGETLTEAKTIVPFAGAGDLVGFGIGYSNDTVDITVASPSALIPRFQLESTDDTRELDEYMAVGSTVNRIDVSSDDDGIQDIQLVPDPTMENVLHVVTNKRIVSISSNAARIASNKAHEDSGTSSNVFSPPSKRRDLQPKTTAWSCIDVGYFQGNQNPIVGAVVSSDVQFGHILIARLMNGKMLAINFTEARHLQEMDSVAGDKSGQPLAIQDGSSPDISDYEKQTLIMLESTKPLADIVRPMMQQVYDGLSRMAIVEGSSTPQDQIDLQIMAGAVAIQEQCQKEVFLPLMEMNEHVTARRIELKEMCKKQTIALKALQDMIEKLREKQSCIQDKAEVVQINARTLAERSASVLQASKDIVPTITQAEANYFEEIKRLDGRSSQWQSEIERIKVKISSLCESIASDSNFVAFSLSGELLEPTQKMLKGSSAMLESHSEKLASFEERVDTLSVLAGFVPDPEVSSTDDQ